MIDKAYLRRMRKSLPFFEPPWDEVVKIFLDEITRLRAQVEELRDKALRYDLDAAGIQQREAEAVELVNLRARVAGDGSG
jgi:hypothetical protein